MRTATPSSEQEMSLQLLTLFGLPWEDEGVLGIESGGTGSVLSRLCQGALSASVSLSDSTTTDGINTYCLDMGRRTHARDRTTGAGPQRERHGLLCFGAGRRMRMPRANYSHATNRNTTARRYLLECHGRGHRSHGHSRFTCARHVYRRDRHDGPRTGVQHQSLGELRPQ